MANIYGKIKVIFIKVILIMTLDMDMGNYIIMEKYNLKGNGFTERPNKMRNLLTYVVPRHLIIALGINLM